MVKLKISICIKKKLSAIYNYPIFEDTSKVVSIVYIDSIFSMHGY